MIVNVPLLTFPGAVPPSDDTKVAPSGNLTWYLFDPEEACPLFSISTLIVALTVVAVADGDTSLYFTVGVLATTWAPVVIDRLDTIAPR